MDVIALDMYTTAGAGVIALLLGVFLTRKLPALGRMCIPAPVTGGLAVSLLFLLLHVAFGWRFSFDGTVKDLCMLVFFTSVGFQSDLRMLRAGGKPLVVMIGLVSLLIVAQNLLSLGIARGLHIDPLVGMATGSIPMCGGHGTAGGFAPVLAQMGLQGADSIAMAAATFGLVAGSMVGGPVGEFLVRRRRLAEASGSDDVVSTLGGEAPEDGGMKGETTDRHPGAEQIPPSGGEEHGMRRAIQAVCQLLLAMALGQGLSKLLALTGITFPTYFGALVVASLLRNVLEPRPGSGRKHPLCLDKIVSLGNAALFLFLGMAMATLKLWELAGLMLPLLVILLAQTLFIVLFACLAAFPALGKNYDAAVLVSGLCGFGLGATPNAMANMSAVCFKYHYAAKPFIIVPIIGAMFVDLINTFVVTVLLNVL